MMGVVEQFVQRQTCSKNTIVRSLAYKGESRSVTDLIRLIKPPPLSIFVLLSTSNNRPMEHKAISIRPFIGAKDFEISRHFYRAVGFQEVVLSPGFSLFQIRHLAFYLQDAYVKDWIDNTMIFLEVDDAGQYYEQLLALQLERKYNGVKLSPVRSESWGRECFLHDPSGILWHFGEFFSEK
jgi:catechol 2,3-dioxygenase-like lactoylglutathione lyase family enzyme